MSRPPVQASVPANGIQFATYEWPAEGDTLQPPVVLLHATSFHARCWDQVVAHLADYRCLALDARGHGHTDKPPLPYSWQQFGQDAAAMVSLWGVQGAVGVGHSMGGNALVRAAAALPGAFRALLLVDPVIFPPQVYHEHPAEPEKHFTASRRNHWSSPHAMFERFKDRPPFNTWDRQVLHDYCQYGLLRAPDGHGYVLACPPLVEAQTYTTSTQAQNRDIYDLIPHIQVPVRVLRAARPAASPGDFAGSPTNPDLARAFPHGEDVPLPDNTHFIPMESPALVAKHIRDLSTTPF